MYYLKTDYKDPNRVDDDFCWCDLLLFSIENWFGSLQSLKYICRSDVGHVSLDYFLYKGWDTPKVYLKCLYKGQNIS